MKKKYTSFSNLFGDLKSSPKEIEWAAIAEEVINEYKNETVLENEKVQTETDEIISNLNIALASDDYSKVFNFNREPNNVKDIEPLFDEFTFSNLCDDFFKTFLVDYPWELYESNKYDVIYLNLKLKAFKTTLINDAILHLLKDAVTNITNSIISPKQRSLYKPFISMEMLPLSDLKNLLNAFIKDHDFIGNNKIDKLEDYLVTTGEHTVYKLPKIALPWYFYALYNTFSSIVAPENKHSIIIKKKLSLEKPPRKDYPCKGYSDKHLSKYLDNLNVFFKLIEVIPSISNPDSPSTDKTYAYDKLSLNKSLTAELFNDSTNLLDLHLITNGISLFLDKPTEDSIVLEKHFTNLSKIVNLSGLGIKHCLLASKNLHFKNTLSDKKTIPCLEKVKESLCLYIKDFIQQTCDFKNQTNDIDLFIYQKWHSFDPYNASIDEVGSEIDYILQNPNDFRYRSSFYAYKCLYSNKFSKSPS